jgi:hypothetical protein
VKCFPLLAIVPLALPSATLGTEVTEDPCNQDAAITLDLKGRNLGEAVHELYSQSHCTIGFPVTIAKLEGAGVYLDAVPLQRALIILAAAYGVCSKVESGFAMIEPCKV